MPLHTTTALVTSGKKSWYSKDHMNSNIFNAHLSLNLKSLTTCRAKDLYVYDNVHELINASYSQYMPTLLNIDDFTEDQKKQAKLVVEAVEPSDRYDADYSTCWRNGLPRCTVQLLTNINTRRAVILFTDKFPQPSCLSSIQFLVRNQQLELIANFRSWELQEFAKYDLCLLLEMAKEMSRHLADIPLGNLFIHVGSAHILIQTSQQ